MNEQDKAKGPRYYDGRRDAREGLSPTSTASEYSRGHTQGRRDRTLRELNGWPINEAWCRSTEGLLIGATVVNEQLSAVYAANEASQEIRAALSTAHGALTTVQATVHRLEDECDKVWDKAYDNYLEERRTV